MESSVSVAGLGCWAGEGQLPRMGEWQDSPSVRTIQGHGQAHLGMYFHFVRCWFLCSDWKSVWLWHRGSQSSVCHGIRMGSVHPWQHYSTPTRDSCLPLRHWMAPVKGVGGRFPQRRAHGFRLCCFLLEHLALSLANSMEPGAYPHFLSIDPLFRLLLDLLRGSFRFLLLECTRFPV